MFFPVFERAHTGLCFKEPGKRTDGRIADHVADNLDGIGGIDQKILGNVDSAVGDVFIYRNAKHVSEQSVKRGLTYGKMAREIIGIEVFAVMFL